VIGRPSKNGKTKAKYAYSHSVPPVWARFVRTAENPGNTKPRVVYWVETTAEKTYGYTSVFEAREISARYKKIDRVVEEQLANHEKQ
jgi:hypothetical protein